MTGWADRELVVRQQARSRRSCGVLIGARRHGAARLRDLITLTRAGPYEPGAPLAHLPAAHAIVLLDNHRACAWCVLLLWLGKRELLSTAVVVDAAAPSGHQGARLGQALRLDARYLLAASVCMSRCHSLQSLCLAANPLVAAPVPARAPGRPSMPGPLTAVWLHRGGSPSAPTASRALICTRQSPGARGLGARAAG